MKRERERDWIGLNWIGLPLYYYVYNERNKI